MSKIVIKSGEHGDVVRINGTILGLSSDILIAMMSVDPFKKAVLTAVAVYFQNEEKVQLSSDIGKEIFNSEL